MSRSARQQIRPVPPAARPGKRFRLAVEGLEDRLTPASFQISSALDDGSAGTLRDAITRANNSADPFNTITFTPGLAPIVLQSALPDLLHSLAIEGPGAGKLTVARSSAPATPAFSVFSVKAGSVATLIGLTISGGNAADGGGIHNEGNLTLRDARVTGNTATDKGGGIFNNPPPITAGSGTPGGANIFNSVIDHNTTSGSGGAAGIDTESDSLSLENTTVADNQSTATANSNAGGVAVNGGLMTIANSTIAANTATGAAAGGVEVAGNGTALLQDTIVATNQGAGTEPDVRGNVLSQGNNLIGVLANSADAPALQNGSKGDQVGSTGQVVDPKLGALQDNGGATPTMALASDSPAKDFGSPTSPADLPADQRGFQRVDDNLIDQRIDIGAFEYQSGTPLFGAEMLFSSNTGSSTVLANQGLIFTVDLHPAVTGATSAVPTGIVRFSVDGGQPIAAGNVMNGETTLTLAGLAPGQHTIMAAYAGDGTFAPNNAAVSLTAMSPAPGPGTPPGGTSPPSAPPLQGDVTGHVRIGLSAAPAAKKHRSKKFIETLTIANTSGQPLQGPLSLVLRGLRGTIKVEGAAGKVGSKKKRFPFVVLSPAGGAVPAQGSASMTLTFSAKPNSFTVAVFAGTAPH
jgi:hypothetical protein